MSTGTNPQRDFAEQVSSRIAELAALATSGGLDEAIDLLVASIREGGVIQAFGTGHSEAFAMEIAGRAGGLIPAHRIALRNVVLRGSRVVEDLVGADLERDGTVVPELLDLTDLHPADVFVIASNSGVNSSIVGMALAAKERGHQVIAVTSLAHTNAVAPKHPSGMRLAEVADVVVDNLAPYGDATVSVGDSSGAVTVGAVSSITAAYIAQALTIGVVTRLLDGGEAPPVYISANVPGGDEHNDALTARYGGRIQSL
ncbi:sugar isomerase domain-containing protein [Pseudactinotalea sp.]|uniref:sugar isomerase domain-containing protein n=1 Tax=Pseudactinotalea sp. TaxID=1926260 RepID=UPI003B3AE19A